MMKTFSTDAVLTVVTGRMLQKTGIAETQALVEFVMQRPVMTHELGLALEPVSRAILQQHPAMIDALAENSALGGEPDVQNLQVQIDTWNARYGSTLEIVA